MGPLVEYYEFPNGEIVKRIQSDGVYRLDPSGKIWTRDPSLTAEFAWDRPYGEPCEHLRQKIDLDSELPPFPDEGAFFVGNTVLIGAYPQRSLHDFSPIAWTVLEVTDTTALCIAKDCLITSGYCDPHAPGKPEWIWWENSIARKICNCDFFESAFSEGEKARIIPRKVSGVQFGKECADRVFLLSEQEIRHYFPTDRQRMAAPTACAVQKGAFCWRWDEEKIYTGWWLLPEENAYGYQDGSIYPKAVFPNGEIQFHGRNVLHGDFTIRPCIQIQYK